MDPSHGLIWPQYKGQYNKCHLLQHGITWDFITLKVKRKLSKLCAARSLAANQQREAISTDVRMCDAISWGSCKGSCSSGDKKELVPKQRHVIEAELAPPKKSIMDWTHLFRPQKALFILRCETSSAYPVQGCLWQIRNSRSTSVPGFSPTCPYGG